MPVALRARKRGIAAAEDPGRSEGGHSMSTVDIHKLVARPTEPAGQSRVDSEELKPWDSLKVFCPVRGQTK